ncbi:MAG: c-type cytochrome [Anaerolineae bacterium]|nr:c-type cytochrome [Anaerolineae bacterium]MCO5195582.1 c-type cytochrome [Anaerolineae bacterium]
MKSSIIWLGTLLLVLIMALAACGGDSGGDSAPASDAGSAETSASADTNLPTGDVAAGEAKFNEVCIACHGPGGEGVEGLGKPFTTSDFVTSQSDAELLAFVKVGRPVGDPANTTGIDMPPKGGNPALTDQQLMDIIAYIRTLHE